MQKRIQFINMKEGKANSRYTKNMSADYVRYVDTAYAFNLSTCSYSFPIHVLKPYSMTFFITRTWIGVLQN
jgi:hypothetical protein